MGDRRREPGGVWATTRPPPVYPPVHDITMQPLMEGMDLDAPEEQKEEELDDDGEEDEEVDEKRKEAPKKADDDALPAAPAEINDDNVVVDENAPAPGVDQLIQGSVLMRQLREFWESKGYDRKQAITFATRAMDHVNPPQSRSASSSEIQEIFGSIPASEISHSQFDRRSLTRSRSRSPTRVSDTRPSDVEHGSVSISVEPVNPNIQPAGGGDVVEIDPNPEDDTGSIDDSPSPSPAPEPEVEDGPTQAEIDTLLALPAVGTVDKQPYPYDEEKGDFKSSDPMEDDNYWPFDRGVIQDGTLEFSPPNRRAAEQPLPIGLLRCMGYDGDDHYRESIEVIKSSC